MDDGVLDAGVAELLGPVDDVLAMMVDLGATPVRDRRGTRLLRRLRS
jgi:hypothetical protein